MLLIADRAGLDALHSGDGIGADELTRH